MSAPISHRIRDYVRSHISAGVAVQFRLETKKQLRIAKQLASAVPTLGSSRPLREWRSALVSPHNSAKRRAEQCLKALAEVYGEKPFFKPRPSSPADTRMARLFPTNTTPLLPCAQCAVWRELYHQTIGEIDYLLECDERDERFTQQIRAEHAREHAATQSRASREFVAYWSHRDHVATEDLEWFDRAYQYERWDLEANAPVPVDTEEEQEKFDAANEPERFQMV